MARKHKRERKPVGISPGSMIYIGEHPGGRSVMKRILYSAEGAQEAAAGSMDCSALQVPGKLSWLHLSGLSDTAVVREIGDCLGLHPLQMEDIVNTEHRAKIEITDALLFSIVKHCTFGDAATHIEHVVIVLTASGVVSFSEHNPEVFQPVIDRLLAEPSRIHSRGADYLYYALLDCIVDHHVTLLEQIDDEIVELEERLLRSPDGDVLRDIHELRRSTLLLRKSMLPLRDIVMELLRTETLLIVDETRFFLRDVSDHIVHILDTLEHDREVLGTLVDLYMSMESNKLNEVMKVLTMISTIFIPLTFIAGVYGMNFRHMPELWYPWAYPAILSLMSAIAISMLVYFRKKRWL